MPEFFTPSNLGYVLSAAFWIVTAILLVVGSVTKTKRKWIIAIYAIVPPVWFC
jgi:hypothetical protein